MTFLLRALVLLVVFTGAAWAAIPKITNLKGTPTSGTTATLSAQITASSGSPVEVSFDYGTTTSYGQTTKTTASANADAQTVTASLTGLTVGALYHFRVRVETVEDETAQSADQTFLQSATVTLGKVGHNATTGVITLNGAVVPNGVAGSASFEYGVGDAFDKTAGLEVVGAAATSVAATAVLPDGQFGIPLFNYRLVFKPTSGTPARIVSMVGKTNTVPKAAADSLTLDDARPVTLSVLGNDSDAESDTLTITAVTKPRFGTAAISADKKQIVYTPTKDLLTADTFRYTIIDGFAGQASATVTISPLRAVLAGTHGGLIRNADGKEIGYFRIAATQFGSFTGVVMIEGKSYLLAGSFGADGSFHGAASRDGMSLLVDLTTVLGDNGTTIQAKFAQGQYTAEVEFTEDEATTRGPLAGRYTVELPASGGGTTDGSVGSDGSVATTNGTPEGTGWAALKVGADGSVRVKGRLPDGRSIATRGTLVVGPDGPKITFFENLEDTRVAGTFTVGDTVTGSLHVDRARSGDGIFGSGYDTMLTANGARYVPPGGDVELLRGTRRLTIEFSGGGVPSGFTRNLEISGRNKIEVVDDVREVLKVKLDKSSGRFQTKLIVEDDGPKLKGTGVIIQPAADGSGGSGGGVFHGRGQTKPGRIQITAGSTSTPITPLPTPTPGNTNISPIVVRAPR